MRETFVPAIVPAPQSGNITTLITDRAKSEPHRVLLSRAVGEGWQSVTAYELQEEIRSVARGLIAHGVTKGDRVAIMAKTRYEWTILDFAILFSGAITVPVYETSSAHQLQWILEDSGARILIVESPTLAEMARQVLPDPSLEILTISEGALPSLIDAGRSITDADLDDRLAKLHHEDIMTLIYTSGTTGNPKGVTFTHGNFMVECSNVASYAREEFLRPGGSTLLFLPIAHVFGRMIQFGAFQAGLHMAHCADMNRLTKDLATFKPTLLLAVPRVFEKVFNSAEAKATESGKAKLFKKAVEIAIKRSESFDGTKMSVKDLTLHFIFDKILYSKIRAGLGGQVLAAISGGAPLSPRLGHFFRGAGMNILEGYGLTETTAAVSLNVRTAQKIGSVGKPIPSTRIRIDADGEILIQGPVVMQGYWRNDGATNEVMTEDGFFRTGDLGSIDLDGYLFIVGRKKEIIVTSGGKNVAPEVLEDRLRSHPLISQCIVVGDNKPFIAALVTLDADALRNWSITNKKMEAPIGSLLTDSALLEVVQNAVDDANKAVSKAESIRKFTILPGDFSIADGQLTAKLSVKRHVIHQQYSKEISDLFA
jgi:long-chain acyl-CoA synthetase